MRLGIFGGTFAPPHNTHIAIAQQAIKQLALDNLIVMPNGQPPHKRTLLDATHRLNMAHLAFDGIKGVTVSDYEVKRGGDSYTYLTLNHFQSLYPEAELYFILGGDSLRDFDYWVNPQIIADKAILAVCRRGGVEYEKAINNVKARYNARICEIITDVSNVSSRALRVALAYLQASALPDNCKQDLLAVPEAVRQYVLCYKLFALQAACIAQLKPYLTQERFAHTYRTILAGLALSGKEDENKVFTACLLHDCAKSLTRQDWARYGYLNPNNCPAKLVHAELGALVANKDFGITDPDVLNAIYYHTTARAGMSELEKIVYTADKIERGRPFPTAHLMHPTLNATFEAVLEEAVQATLKKGIALNPLTIQAIKYYLKKDIQ